MRIVVSSGVSLRMPDFLAAASSSAAIMPPRIVLSTLNHKCFTVFAAMRACGSGDFKQLAEQFDVLDVVLLMQPECFEQMMGVFFLVRIELLDPLLGGGDDFLGVALAEFDARAMANAIDGRFQILEQSGDRLAVDGDRLLQRAADGRHAIDAAVRVVAIGIAHVVLHVADDDVVPVAEIQRAIGCEDRIGGAEVLVAAHQQAA